MKKSKIIHKRIHMALLAIFSIAICLVINRSAGLANPFKSANSTNNLINESPTPPPPPYPDIKGNGQDGPITIFTSDNLWVTVNLRSGPGPQADLWALVQKPDGNWYHYDFCSQTFQAGLKVTLQGPLFDLGSYYLLNTSGLSLGTHTFYFGVDLTPDGTVSTGNIYYDSLVVNVTAPMSHYTDNKDGTVTDINTGLMWQQQDNGSPHDWYAASGTAHSFYNSGGKINICSSLNLAGYSDWRLPSINELKGLIKVGVIPAIDTTYFPGSHSSPYWSSSSYLADPQLAWAVTFSTGVASAHYKQSFRYYTSKCVRG